MKEQHEAITLHDLDRSRASSHRVECILQEIVGKGTTSGHRTWHSGFLSLPGFLGFTSLIPKVYPNQDVICETDHLGFAWRQTYAKPQAAIVDYNVRMTDIPDTAVDSKFVDLERRLQAVEARVAALPDPQQLEERVTERVKAKLPPPIDPSQPPSFQDIELPIPNFQTVVATAKTTWTLLEMFSELNMLFWTLMDRRYHMAWITRVITIVLLVLILTSHWWAPLAGSDNFISHFWDKVIDLILGLILFIVLSFETRRYKEWRSRR